VPSGQRAEREARGGSSTSVPKIMPALPEQEPGEHLLDDLGTGPGPRYSAERDPGGDEADEKKGQG
jgi:hypothetical protein